MWSFDEILHALLISQTVLCAIYIICSLIISANKYAGFNAVLVGIIMTIFLSATYYVLKRELSRLNFGAVLGGACGMMVITAQSAVFWGGYWHCESAEYKYSGCNHRSTMQTLCVMSSLLCVGYFVQVVSMLFHKDEILAEVPIAPSVYRPISSQQSIVEPLG